MPRNVAERTYEHLSALRETLPLLDEALIPGTPRRWAQRDLTPEQALRMDEMVRAERAAKLANAAKGIKALGDGKAPLRLDVLDTTADVVGAVAELEDAVCDQLGITPLAGPTTRERIDRLVGLLDRIEAHEDLAEHVHREAMRLHHAASRAIGDTETVRRLDARCPICDSLSLRALPERELVVCVNRACLCIDEGCGCHLERPQRHKWAYDQWPWLAQMLNEDLQTEEIAS